MKIQIVKRDGRGEEFVYEKNSCLKSGVTLDVVGKIAKIVEARPLETGVNEVSAKD